MLNSALSEILSELSERHQCRRASLVTRAGSLMGAAGKEGAQDGNLSKTLAAVATGLGSGGREMCRLLGEEPPDLMLVRGVRKTALVAEMPNEMLLVAVFPFEISEQEARSAVEWTADRLIALSPARIAPGDRSAVGPELRDQALRFLDEIFA